ncbi:MAG TPA: protein kinase, partial [Planctomycetota bacterium]|nr:protein kinase [Planctomycetota bacterium]
MGELKNCPKCGGFIPESDPDTPFAGACPWCMAQGSFDLKAPAEDPRLKASARLGKYQLTEKLGHGGMGEVWKALDTDLNRWVALKFLKAEDPSHLARLQREAHTAAGLTHPNIAGIYEIDDVEGRHFIAMQYVQGRTLETYSREDRRVLVQLIRTAARALEHAHRHGIIHRDVKPANIMVEQTEEGPRAIVLDFGLARPIEGGETLSHSGSVVGTPAYMSPEQARGEKLDERTDVYSLGATLYDLLTGKPPFEGTGVLDVVKKVETTEPVAPRKLNPNIPRDLETVAMKCLEKDRNRRFGSAKDLADDLSRWLAGDAVMARPASTIYRLRMKLSKRRAVVITAAAGLAVSVILAVLLLPQLAWRHGAERAQPHLDLARTRIEQREQLFSVDENRRDEREILLSQARESLRKALEECPDHAESLYELGKLQATLREREAALESFAKAIQAAPEMGKAYLERAMVRLEMYERHRHKDGGDLRPENEHARRIRELLAKDLDQARKWSTEVPKLDLLEGLLRFAEGRYAEAAKKLEEYLKKSPSDWWAWMWRGHALVHAKQDPEALASLDRSLALRPRNTDALSLRALARGRLK